MGKWNKEHTLFVLRGFEVDNLPGNVVVTARWTPEISYPTKLRARDTQNTEPKDWLSTYCLTDPFEIAVLGRAGIIIVEGGHCG